MRILPIDAGLIGEKLGHSIFDPSGRLLLAAGVGLTERSVSQLEARGYRSVPVFDPLAPDAVPNEAIDEKTRALTTAVVTETLQAVEQGGAFVLEPVRRAIERIFANVMKNSSLVLHLSNLRGVNDAVLTHSINVAVYSVMLAHSVGLPRGDIENIGVGALLHDIGAIYYMDLVRRSHELTPEEQELFKQHTTDGYELLRRQRAIDIRVAHVAYQHHERLDGSGYPRGLRGADIHVWAQIVAVADALDDLVSEAPGCKGLPCHQAMNVIVELAQSGQVDARYVRHLVRRLAAFPEGTIVLLETGEISVVTGQTKTSTWETAVPRIRILTDPQLCLTEPAERVATGLDAATTIVSVLPDYPPRVHEQLQGAVCASATSATSAM